MGLAGLDFDHCLYGSDLHTEFGRHFLVVAFGKNATALFGRSPEPDGIAFGYHIIAPGAAKPGRQIVGRQVSRHLVGAYGTGRDGDCSRQCAYKRG